MSAQTKISSSSYHNKLDQIDYFIDKGKLLVQYQPKHSNAFVDVSAPSGFVISNQKLNVKGLTSFVVSALAKGYYILTIVDGTELINASVKIV